MILQTTHSSTHMGLLWFLPVSVIAIFPLRRLWNRMINSQVSGQDATSSFKLSSWVWSHVIVCAARSHWSNLSAKGAEELPRIDASPSATQHIRLVTPRCQATSPGDPSGATPIARTLPTLDSLWTTTTVVVVKGGGRCSCVAVYV